MTHRTKFNALTAPSQPPSRWNVEGDESRVRICFGYHERAQGCEWIEFEPTPAPSDDALRRALEGLLQHSHIADADPEDVDEEDRALERAARRALAGTPSPAKPRGEVSNG